MATKRPRAKGKAGAGKPKRRPARPFRPKWPDNEVLVHSSTPVNDDKFAGQVVSFQRLIDREERTNEWKRNEDARFRQDQELLHAQRKSGRVRTAKRRSARDEHELRAVAKACDIVTQWGALRIAPPSAGWTPYSLAMRVRPHPRSKAWAAFDKYDQDRLNDSFGSFAVVYDALRIAWRWIEQLRKAPALWHSKRGDETVLRKFLKKPST